MKYGLVFALIILSVFLFGCASQSNSGPAGNAALTTQSAQSLEIKGSDTMLQLVSNWAEAFSRTEPATSISVTGGGSGTGIAALINGEIFVANSSREIKEEEILQARERGFEPLEFVVARDTLSVIVHKGNPLSQLSMEEVGRIFRGEITNWKEVGGNDEPITLYGRQSTSGTYVFFQEHVLKGDYALTMRNMEGSQAIVDAVAQDRTGIGYVGVGYAKTGEETGRTKTLSIALDAQSEFISPFDKEKELQYPISRGLFQYVSDKFPKDSAAYRFLAFEISGQGQNIVLESGFVEITEPDKSKNNELLAKIK